MDAIVNKSEIIVPVNIGQNNTSSYMFLVAGKYRFSSRHQIPNETILFIFGHVYTPGITAKIKDDN